MQKKPQTSVITASFAILMLTFLYILPARGMLSPEELQSTPRFITHCRGQNNAPTSQPGHPFNNQVTTTPDPEGWKPTEHSRKNEATTLTPGTEIERRTTTKPSFRWDKNGGWSVCSTCDRLHAGLQTAQQTSLVKGFEEQDLRLKLLRLQLKKADSNETSQVVKAESIEERIKRQLLESRLEELRNAPRLIAHCRELFNYSSYNKHSRLNQRGALESGSEIERRTTTRSSFRWDENGGWSVCDECDRLHAKLQEAQQESFVKGFEEQELRLQLLQAQIKEAETAEAEALNTKTAKRQREETVPSDFVTGSQYSSGVGRGGSFASARVRTAISNLPCFRGGNPFYVQGTVCPNCYLTKCCCDDGY